VAQLPPQRLMSFAVPLYTLGVALLIAVAIFGVTKKGARRWINLGVVIQPSEILKIAMPLMLAWWFQRREGQSVEMLLEHRVRRHAPHGSAVSREGGRRAEHPLTIRQRCGAEPHGSQEAAAGGGECLHECSL
jgi:hypothetical protein